MTVLVPPRRREGLTYAAVIAPSRMMRKLLDLCLKPRHVNGWNPWCNASCKCGPHPINRRLHTVIRCLDVKRVAWSG
jgi:hypothetical protein